MAKFFTPTKLSENIRETPEGFLLCLGVPIARTGWQDYADGETPLKVGPDGIIKIYRDSKEVFRAQTIASFQGKSVTITHPKDFVAPDNWQELTHGVAQNVRRGDEKDENGEETLLADLLITDAEAIKKVNAGLREVSCGYEAEYEQTGEGEGRQFNIVGNHIALVEEGRAGSSYAINDHKGKVSVMNVLKELAEKLKALGKTVDEAVAKEKPAEEKKEDKAKDASSYDELVKAVKDLSDKVEGFKKADDAEKPAEEKKDEKPAEDAEEEKPAEEKPAEDEGSDLEKRLSALEAAVAKMLESKDEESDEDEESEDEESEEDMSGDEESAEAKEKEKAKDSKATGLENTKDSKGFSFDSKTEVMTAEKLNEIHAAHWARK